MARHRRPRGAGGPFRLLGVVATLAAALVRPPSVGANEEPAVGGLAGGTPHATVVGAPAVNVRACPALDCAVLVSAPLGDQVALTGPPVDGFSPVAYGGHAGFAYGLYLAPEGGPVPRLSRGQPGCARVALIFNVGIGWEPDAGILATLALEGVSATMFLMGWWARERPDLAAEMATAGHAIGSHGDRQVELTDLSDAEVAHEVTAAAAAIQAATGAPPGRWFTPYAAATDDRVRAVVAGLGYLPVGWDVPAADYGPDATAASVWSRVVPHAYDGAIVEFHLDGPASAASTGVALPWVIADLRAAGYRLVTIPELATPCT